FRLTVAGVELSISSMAQYQIALALRASLFEGHVRYFRSLVESACCLAIRISCASHELSEAASLQHHHAAAIFTIFFLGSLRHFRRIEIGQSNWILFRKGTTARIVLLIGAAGKKR